MIIWRQWFWKCSQLMGIGTIVLIGVQSPFPGVAQTPKPVTRPTKPLVQPRQAPAPKPPVRTPSNRSRRLTFIPPLPPQTGRASVTRGAATRSGTCSSVPLPLTALVPTHTLTTGEVMGIQQTTSAYPTLWVYLPYELTPERPAELRLEIPATGQYVTQRTVLRLTAVKAGIIGIQIPATEAPLKVGQRTDWTFVVRCDPNDFSANKFVNLSVQRIEVARSLQQQLAIATPIDRVALYAEAGIWENALTTLANLRQQFLKQSDLTADWAQLLGAINFSEDFSQQPISHPSTNAKNHFLKAVD
ncbi:DUF928 domain-containing protein [Pantanalinema sp. GBBB05]|uniref:DUF928 domain-containing protein n=1 Tax=Pantanalinema sp. GBBB05 TaxID=2604139 RepID=UPI001D23D80D|nr:DUF928 domain-containing protein [Pantanalinema sp. GBBB05]